MELEQWGSCKIWVGSPQVKNTARSNLLLEFWIYISAVKQPRALQLAILKPIFLEFTWSLLPGGPCSVTSVCARQFSTCFLVAGNYIHWRWDHRVVGYFPTVNFRKKTHKSTVNCSERRDVACFCVNNNVWVLVECRVWDPQTETLDPHLSDSAGVPVADSCTSEALH